MLLNIMYIIIIKKLITNDTIIETNTAPLCFTTFSGESNSNFGSRILIYKPNTENDITNNKSINNTKIEITRSHSNKKYAIIMSAIINGVNINTFSNIFDINTDLVFIGADFNIQKFFPSSDILDEDVEVIDIKKIIMTPKNPIAKFGILDMPESSGSNPCKPSSSCVDKVNVAATLSIGPTIVFII